MIPTLAENGRHLIEIQNVETDDDSISSENESDNDSPSSNELTENEDTEDKSDYDYEKTKLKCLYCDKEFLVQSYLEKHIKTIHTQTETFKCNKCDKLFSQKKHLKRHRENVHGYKRTGVLELKNMLSGNICSICGSTFTRADNLNEHVKRAHMKTAGEFICKFCNKKFDRKWNLSRHGKTCVSNLQ